jgi:hypothetical protein
VSVAPAICDDFGCGDYNQNGTVDAADYVVWRKTLGQSGPDLAADGNSNELVEAADYYVWRKHFGRVAIGAAAQTPLPEPSAFLLFAIAGLLRRCIVGRHRTIP